MKGLGLSSSEERVVAMLRALGSPARFKIIRYLAECRQCIVADLVEQTPLAQSTVSQHVKVLRDAGLIQGEIEGPAMNYCLDTHALAWLLQRLGNLRDQASSEMCCPDDECLMPDIERGLEE